MEKFGQKIGFMQNKKINLINTMSSVDYNKYINYLIIFYALALPISKAGTVFSEILLILLWILQGNFKSKFYELKQSNFIIFFSAFILLGIIAILWSSDKLYAIAYIKKYWHYLVIPIIYTSLQKPYIKHVISAFLAGMLISEIFSYSIFFELIHYKDRLPSDPSPFMDHMNYSVYLAWTSIILLNRIFFEKFFQYKVFYFLYFLITTSSLFLNAGRSGQVLFLVSVFTLGLLNIKNKIKSLLIMFFLSGFVLSTAYIVSPNFNQRANALKSDIERMVYNDQYTGGLGQRVALWTMGTNVFFDNLAYGTGLGDEIEGAKNFANQYNFTIYKDIEEHGYIDYHNAYIQYGIQLGIVGLILFISIFYILLRTKFTSTIYRNLNISFTIIFGLYSMSLCTFHLMNPMVLFALFAALFSSISRLEISKI